MCIRNREVTFIWEEETGLVKLSIQEKIILSQNGQILATQYFIL